MIRRRVPRFGDRRLAAHPLFRSGYVTLGLCLYLILYPTLNPVQPSTFARTLATIRSIDTSHTSHSFQTSKTSQTLQTAYYNHFAQTNNKNDSNRESSFRTGAFVAFDSESVPPSLSSNPQSLATPPIPPESTMPPSAFTEAIEQAIRAIQDKNPGLAQNAGESKQNSFGNLESSGENISPEKGGRYNAVVRIVAVTPEGIALGSGSLIAVSKDYGLILTNWHVVGGASGPIVVAFPGGYRSQAKILKTDEMWDLAAIAIWRPPVNPLSLSPTVPVKGDRLRIVGYGDGTYRCVEGVCTQFVAPDPTYPFEMLELSVAARHGDSGGPILNDRDEIAGVLFGAADNCTTGSHCGRVANFLREVMPLFQSLPEGPLPEAQKIAGIPRPEPMVRATEISDLSTNSNVPPFPDTPATISDTTTTSSDATVSNQPDTDAALPQSDDVPRVSNVSSSTDLTQDLTQDNSAQTAEAVGSSHSEPKSNSEPTPDDVDAFLTSPSMDSDILKEKASASDGTKEDTGVVTGPSPVLIIPSAEYSPQQNRPSATIEEAESPSDSEEKPLWLRGLHLFFDRPIYSVVRDILALIGCWTVLRYLVRTAIAERRRRHYG